MINKFSDILKKSGFLLSQAESQGRWECGQSLETPLPAIFLALIFLTQFHDCLRGLFDLTHPKYQPATIVLDGNHCYFFFYNKGNINH